MQIYNDIIFIVEVKEKFESSDYLEIISKNTAFNVISAAISNGALFAEIFAEHNSKNTVSLVNGKVDKTISGIDCGLGLRIFDGFGAIYTYSNDLSEDNLIKMAKEAAVAVKNKNYTKTAIPFSIKNYETICMAKIWPESGFKKEVIDKLKISSEACFAYNGLVTQTSGSYVDNVQYINIANSEGLWAEDKRSLVTFSVAAVASEGDEKQSAYSRKGSRSGVEFLNETDFKLLGQQSAETAIKMLKAELCPSGSMPVIIDNGFGGVIFHEACGHSLEATSVAKEASVFCGKLGQVIANEKVTAIDDGTIKNEWGSVNFDDEGTPSAKNVLIEKGVLKSYLVDRLNGMKMNMPSTGSSRRESYKYAPTSRMTNTYIDKGNDKFEDMVSSIEYGLYAKTMGGGSVQPTTGDFNFAVTESYLIEKGKITAPVRGATLIGKGSDVLMDIDMVSDNLTMAAGLCGSISGSVPTNVGQPAIRIEKITVGGRK